MATAQKQSIDLRPGKRMSTALSNENLRIGANSAWAAKIAGTLDESRMHLDFEVGRGAVIKEIDQSVSIPKRIKQILKSHGIDDPNIGLSDEQLKQKRVGVRTHASFILQGSHDTMTKLAFGEQEISFKPNADNSHLQRKEEIEKWAKDMYRFIAGKYGAENIAAFVVHLDETTPHAHCIVVPITQAGTLSFRDVFAGKDKYEFSKRTKALWDEAAKVSEKYGLERGDDKLVTGAKHKSYLQWMREQIMHNQETLDEQEEIISNQANIITDQKQQLYAINGEIKKATKKVKALTTMIANLEGQKQQPMREITELEVRAHSGEITPSELQKLTQELHEQIALIDEKIEDKKQKYDEATIQLRELSIKKHELQKSCDDLVRQMNEDLPDLLEKTQQEVDATMWQEAARQLKQDYSSLEDFSQKLPPELRKEYDNVMEGSFLEDVAQRGEEIAGVAAALFLGYIDQATTFAQNSGGGGGSTSGWGRKKDEDDEAYRRRCCIMGRMMMRPAGRKLKR